MFYSKTTKGFYSQAINGDNMPGDVVPITAEQYAALLQGQSDGMVIAADLDGMPTLVAPAAPTLASLKAAKNAEINAARLAANFTTFPHADKVFSCDALSRSDIDGTNGVITLMGGFPPNWPGGWKAVDNTYVQITTREQWEAFYLSMCATGAANFAHSQTLKATLAAATTAEQVAAITW
ncbi:MAG: DUF4376 domain-containing protein [Rubrivivax sp.]|nr:DUF4376 domain-containing protein [Rubrivivax sp.]MDP3612190.1 DUF4376 domain-containing protein [Rubrivivax sp.]